MSPYVTECPYCGNRLRKRAPDLQREGDEIKVRESRGERRRRRRREKQIEREEAPRTERRWAGLGALDVGAAPVATAGVLIVSAALIVLQRAVPWNAYEVGAIAGPVGSELWRYLVAPFVYEDIGALLVTGGAIAIFGSAVERRIGSVATIILILACGLSGALAADAVASAGLDNFLVVAGGNGIALGLLGAWLMLWRAEAQSTLSEPLDWMGVIAVAVVLLLLPLVEVTADPIAGLVGGGFGLLLGRVAGSRIRH